MTITLHSLFLVLEIDRGPMVICFWVDRGKAVTFKRSDTHHSSPKISKQSLQYSI